MRRIHPAILLLCATIALGQTPEEERLLLPVYAELTHGAHGSLWISEFWVYNGSNERLYVRPVEVFHWEGQAPNTAINPPMRPSPEGSHPGHFIIVKRHQLPYVAFNLRVWDMSRKEQTWGTELLVVPEREFRSDRIVLLNLPAGNRFRRTLRIYQGLPPYGGGGDVRIRAVGMETNEVVWEQQVRLVAEHEGTIATIYRPAYAEIPVNSQFRGSEPIRIEVEPLGSWMKIWAFVSVTNNETQHFTTITPQ